jgi:Tol biopolymer transport system component
MALTPGSHFGSYQIIALVGSGGMGEVYRARDTRLKRDVAVKVLPEQFSQDPDRLARFQREAELLATLNHPGIAAVYGIEQAAADLGIVLELVEGETLADLIARGPLALDDALAIARQLADALEAAHDQGVIHRDLKPANIKVRDDGAVKVLDFGLAKLTDLRASPAAVPAQLSGSPTITSPVGTRVGMILGTAAYMAPEQARGKVVDKRADIWAFGCVLHEMLTGARVFGGDDITDTLAFIITKDPDWAALPKETPEPIRKLLRRCLEKDRRRRLADIADARLEIDEASTATTAAGLASAPADRETAPSPLRSSRFAWAAAAVFFLATVALVGFIVNARRSRTPPPVARFAVMPPESTVFHLPGVGPAASYGFNGGVISPDGRMMAFTLVDAGGKLSIWLRSIDSLAMRPLPGTDGASLPFWSPDSRFIAFFADTKLKKIDVAGGPPVTLAAVEVPNMRGGTWSRDDVILVAPADGPISRVPAAGGEVTPVTKLSPGQSGHRRPYFLPDGRHFLYRTLGTSPGIVVGSLDSDEATPLLPSDAQAIYTSGYLLFTRQGTLLAQPFDAASLKLAGEPVPVAEGVATDVGNGLAAFSASETGVLTYRTGVVLGGTSGSSNVQLAWLDRQGKQLEVIGAPAPYRGVDVSVDGTRVAAHRHEGDGGDIWLLERTRGTTQRFTFDPARDNASAVWSPKGDRIVYASRRGSSWGLYQKLSNSSGSDEEELLPPGAPVIPNSWSPDGEFLVYMINPPKTGPDIWVLPMAGDRKPVPFAQEPFAESFGQISPNGRWMAYMSNETGRPEIYVRPFPSGPGKWPVSTSGGNHPRWRHDGKELYYLSNPPGAEAEFFAVATTESAGGFQAGRPELLFGLAVPAPAAASNGGVPFHPYAILADGQRFLFARALSVAGDEAAGQVHVVLNWQEELKARLAAR